MNLTWRQLIDLIQSSRVDMEETASIRHPDWKDEILHVTNGVKVDTNDPLDGVLDEGHFVLEVDDLEIDE